MSQENSIKSNLVGEGDLESGFFSASFDDLSDEVVDTDTPPVEVENELPEEEEETEIVSTDDKPDDVPEDKPDYSEYSEAALLAMSFQKTGDLHGVEEIGKDWDYNDLRKAFRDSQNSQLQQERDQLLAQMQEARQYVEFIMNGGDPAVLQNAAQSISYGSLNVEGETDEELSNRETVIKAMYFDKGLQEEEVNNLIKGLVADGKDLEKAKLAKSYFAEKEKQLFEADKVRREQEIAAQQRDLTEKKTKISSLLKTGNVKNVDFDPKKALDYERDIFEPTEVITFTDQNGNQQRRMVTKLQKIQMEFESDIESQLAFAILLLNNKGFDVNQIKERSKQEHDDDILDYLNGKIRKGSRSSSSNSKIVSREVGTY